jgi:hypothetical protein
MTAVVEPEYSAVHMTRLQPVVVVQILPRPGVGLTQAWCGNPGSVSPILTSTHSQEYGNVQTVPVNSPKTGQTNGGRIQTVVYSSN